MKNRLFVAYKPMFCSSRYFLNQLNKKYKITKSGFSGTLDPFAKGTMVVAFGDYTRLFRFLKKSPKVYRATLWLGAISDSLDLEKITEIRETKPVKEELIKDVLNSLLGDLSYSPPIYSAKKSNGVRAYKLARVGEEPRLDTISSHIYELSLLNYNHPFLSFEAKVSEGTYIRSLAKIIANRLSCSGALSSLQRLSEGSFIYEDERAIRNIKDYLDLDLNYFTCRIEKILNGEVLDINDFKIKEDGRYLLDLGDYLCIINILNAKVRYVLNRISLC